MPDSDTPKAGRRKQVCVELLRERDWLEALGWFRVKAGEGLGWFRVKAGEG